MKPVTSINELHNLALEDQQYEQLAITAARDLGGDSIENLTHAINWLRTSAMETDEEGVVEEINFCRKLIKTIKIKK